MARRMALDKHTEPEKADIMVGDRFFRHIYSACWDPEVRLREMDRDGSNLQIISGPRRYCSPMNVQWTSLGLCAIVQRCGA